MSGDSLSDTVEDLRLPSAASTLLRAPINVDYGGRTHAGKVRPNNEDNFHVVRFGRYLLTLVSSLPTGEVADEFEQPGYGFAVADGVGGRAAGEIASRLAISILVELALQTPDWIMGREDHMLAKVMDRFGQRFQTVNEEVLARAASQPELKGMGTTLSVAATLGDDLLVTHVGDSPVCLFRNGQLHRLTRDHTADRLWTDPNGASVTRFRRVLTRAIGLSHTGGEPDLYHYRLADGDRLLLCTDGLTDMVGNDTIARELGREASADETCQTLVNLALDRGGQDNVTVVLASFQFPKLPGAEARN